MKKFFTLIVIALAAIAAHAQRGQMAAGFTLMAVPSLESGYSSTNFGFGGKFQYTFTENLRLEGDVDYITEHKGMSQFDLIANAHYIFKVSPRFNMYPIVGLGYASLSYSADFEIGDLEFKDDDSVGRVLFNAGIGFEYNINRNIVASAEVKYQYVKDWSKLPIAFGIAYRF